MKPGGQVETGRLGYIQKFAKRHVKKTYQSRILLPVVYNLVCEHEGLKNMIAASDQQMEHHHVATRSGGLLNKDRTVRLHKLLPQTYNQVNNCAGQGTSCRNHTFAKWAVCHYFRHSGIFWVHLLFAMGPSKLR